MAHDNSCFFSIYWVKQHWEWIVDGWESIVPHSNLVPKFGESDGFLSGFTESQTVTSYGIEKFGEAEQKILGIKNLGNPGTTNFLSFLASLLSHKQSDKLL